MNKKKLLKKSRPVNKPDTSNITALYKPEPRSVTPSRGLKLPISTLTEFANNLINTSCKSLKRKKIMKKKAQIQATPQKIRTSEDLQEKNIFKTINKLATPLENKLDTAFQSKKMIKIYRLTPSGSPLSGRSLIYSSRDQISQRTHYPGSELKTEKIDSVILESKHKTEKVTLEYILDGHRNSVNSLILNSNSLYTASQDYSVKKWRFFNTEPNPYKGKEYLDGQVFTTNMSLLKSPKPILQISLIRSSFLAAASNTSLTFLKESEKSFTKKLETVPKFLKKHNDSFLLAFSDSIQKLDIEKLVFSHRNPIPNTSFIELWNEFCYFSGDSKGNLNVIDSRGEKIITKILTHSDSVTGICVQDTGIYTCSLDGYLKLWDLRVSKLQQKLNSFGSLRKVECIKDRIVTGGDCFRVWTDSSPITVYNDYCKDIIHKDHCILTGSSNKVMVWNIQTVNTTNEYI